MPERVLVENALRWISKVLRSVAHALRWVSVEHGLRVLGSSFFLGYGYQSFRFVDPDKFLILCGSILLCVGYLKDISEFRLNFHGLRVIRQAQNTIEELRNLALSQAKVIIHVAKGAGRYGGMPKTPEVLNDVLQTVEDLGVNEKGQNEVLQVTKKFDNFDLASKTCNAAPREALSDKQREGLELLRRKFKAGVGNEPDPADLRRIMENYDILTDEADAWLRDYEQFYWNGTLRRSETAEFFKNR